MDGYCCGMEQLERSIQRSKPGGDCAGTCEGGAGPDGVAGGVAEGGESDVMMSEAVEPEPAK